MKMQPSTAALWLLLVIAAMAVVCVGSVAQ